MQISKCNKIKLQNHIVLPAKRRISIRVSTSMDPALRCAQKQYFIDLSIVHFLFRFSIQGSFGRSTQLAISGRLRLVPTELGVGTAAD